MKLSFLTPWIVVATWVFFLLGAADIAPWWITGVCGWLSFLLIWSGLNQNAKIQALVLLLLGAGALAFSYSQGVTIYWREVFTANAPLLAMFVAVSFLSLTADAEESKVLPSGRKSLLSTALGIHLFGSVINLSAFFIFGDRLQRQGKLTKLQEIVVARCFCAAAWWSPFFVATGVALTYSPEMQWKTTMVPGLLLASIGIAFTVCELSSRKESRSFQGYPIRFESLFIPMTLAVLVIAAHEMFPDVRVIVLICIFAPLGSLMFMKSKPRGKSIVEFVDKKMLNIGSQFALFLAAGVFSSGIKGVVLAYPDLFNLAGYSLDGWLFVWVAGAMISAGIIGVHPVVSIAIASPLLLPLQPDPNQLALLFLTAWAVGTASSPLSGFGLTLISRYNASGLGVVKNNWYYAVVMWLTASAIAVILF